MKEEEIKAVAEKAMMIVCGYAFSQTEEGFIRVVYLHPPYHALVMTSEGEVTETNMDDIEISIASKYDTFLRKEMKKNKEINRRL
nr:toxin-antitoxin system, toxin component [Prevotella sp.]